jgi:glycerophosphoryl diester phosphodiesterase
MNAVSRRPPITFAHRGAGGSEAPENSLAAFRRALARGATGLESDARLSADGEVVLVHDRALRRGLRRIPVGALPMSVLAEHGVPRLADLYAECGSDYELSLDLKDPEVAGPLIAVARQADAAGRLWLCSNHLDDLVRCRSEAPDVRVVHSLPRGGRGDSLERHAATLHSAGVAALNFHESNCTLGVVTLAKRFGLGVFAWDVQEVRRIRALLGMGIDALYSDHLERLLATVGEWTDGAAGQAG